MEIKDQLIRFKFRLIYRLINPDAAEFQQRLLQAQHWSRDELPAWQRKRLRRLLNNAWEHSPFYRRRFSEVGIHPNDINGPEDLHQLPVLTRQDIRDHLHEILARNVPRQFLKPSTTGGTSGIPVRTLLDRRVPHAALGWRMLSWWGYGPAVNMGLAWREVEASLVHRFLSRAVVWPSRQVRLNASAIDTRSMERFVRECKRLDIPVLHGYTGAIHHLARYLEKRGGDHWRPRLVWVTCSPLSGPHLEQLKRVFRAPVLDQYGSCEVYWIAAQCPYSAPNLHLFADARLVEVTDSRFEPLPTGKIGNLLITDLENLAFPIIRYAIGDRGRLLPGKCECGMGLPLMGPVQGKSVDTIQLPDGTAITDINVIFDDFPEAVNAFQVYQDRAGNLEIRYVPVNNEKQTLRAVHIVRNRLQNMVRGQVAVHMRALEQIPHRKGKLQYVFSDFDGVSDTRIQLDQ
ncbi:MAG TPA: phenylacetate--CoA ligase family protein [Candidatus Aminicenantes bacterium]|nr:phenylacetate--CoA ligase family protein [Candidatus Aminicenantes bacterium]